MSCKPMNATGNKKGITVYPISFQFFADETNSHRQLLTILNPFEQAIKFKGILNMILKFFFDMMIRFQVFIQKFCRPHQKKYSF